ncbi:MAG TPA: CcmD family protein [bacterium]|nr:CcmD family protein [bacterium]
MVYLFWAFAAAWIGLVAYLSCLVRRMGPLEQQVADLRDRTYATSGPATADIEEEN